MRRAFILCFAVTSAGACRRAPPSKGAPSVQAAASAAGGVSAARILDEALGPSSLRLDAAMLERYVRYQRAMTGVPGELSRELAATSVLIDGGGAPAQAIREVYERFAAAQRQAREHSGLSETEVLQIERIVADVVGKHQKLARLTKGDTLARLEALRRTLPASQRAPLDEGVARLRREMDDARALKQERRTYGDANVALVLGREAELAQGWASATAELSAPLQLEQNAAPGRGAR